MTGAHGGAPAQEGEEGRKDEADEPTHDTPHSKEWVWFLCFPTRKRTQTLGMGLLSDFFKKKRKRRKKNRNPTPKPGSLDTFCLDSWQTAGCRSRTLNNYLLARYFIWLPKSGLFYTEPWKNTLHLLKENNTPLEMLCNVPPNPKTFSQDLL